MNTILGVVTTAPRGHTHFVRQFGTNAIIVMEMILIVTHVAAVVGAMFVYTPINSMAISLACARAKGWEA